MVKVTELKKLLKEGFPPFKILAYDSEGSQLSEEEKHSADEVLKFVKEFFGGSLRGVNMEVSSDPEGTIVELEKGKSGRVEIRFKRVVQTSLADFFR